MPQPSFKDHRSDRIGGKDPRNSRKLRMKKKGSIPNAGSEWSKARIEFEGRNNICVKEREEGSVKSLNHTVCLIDASKTRETKGMA
ncbi:uncharacterized protein G2W53_025359 [Senna tora]|uniref:Uncharacterized protein n=1 Tax=Senna tora TaxID=362788 RepID=A0A834WK71_9FABA|nr:uncharacterized protein G2W53_025359 [Senna tora]